MKKAATTAKTTIKSIIKKIDAFISSIFLSFSVEISSAPTGSRPITPTPVFKLDFIL